MSFLPSASKIGLALACRYPWTSGLRWPRFQPSAAAAYGTAVSSVAECLAVWGAAPVADIAAANDVDAARLARAAVALGDLLDEDDAVWRSAEQTLAIDPRRRTARVMRRTGPRDYSDARPGELSGTTDLTWRRHSGRLVVRDYKTGQYARGLAPRDSAQLRMLGCAAALAFGDDVVDVELVQVDDGACYARTDTLDAWDLDTILAELAELAAGIELPSVPRPGRHCTDAYCPVVAECPATRAALVAVDQASALTHPFSPAITSPAHAASVRVRLKMVEEATAQVRAALEAYVAEHGAVEVSPGVWYGPVLCDGVERVDLGAAGALDAVRRHLGQEADGALEVKTSKSALEAGARAVARAQGRAGKGAVSGVRDALYAELRALGALRQGAPFTRFQEFKKENANG